MKQKKKKLASNLRYLWFAHMLPMANKYSVHVTSLIHEFAKTGRSNCDKVFDVFGQDYKNDAVDLVQIHVMKQHDYNDSLNDSNDEVERTEKMVPMQDVNDSDLNRLLFDDALICNMREQ